jgi:hypothetical protein
MKTETREMTNGGFNFEVQHQLFAPVGRDVYSFGDR